MMTTGARRLGMLVGRARRGLRREFEARIARFDLTLPQIGVLMALWHEDGQAIRSLSETISCDGPTLTAVLDRLEAKELIQRERTLEDRRSIRIFLRPNGRALEQDVMRAGEEVMEIVRRGMSQDQLDQLCTLLLILCETMEAAPLAAGSERESTDQHHAA